MVKLLATLALAIGLFGQTKINLENQVQGQLPEANGGSINVTSYNWSKATSVNLTGSVQGTITVSSCPKGIDGGDSPGHTLSANTFIGLNSTTAAPLTGGTCYPGKGSGTLKVTPLSNISVSTIHSPSGGIQEAINTFKTGATLRIPPGSYSLYARVTVPSNVILAGSGWSTVLTPVGWANNSLWAISIGNINPVLTAITTTSGARNVQIRDLKVDQNNQSVGVLFGSTLSLIETTNSKIDNVWSYNNGNDGGVGIGILGISPTSNTVSYSMVTGTGGVSASCPGGIFTNGTGNTIANNVVGGSGSDALCDEGLVINSTTDNATTTKGNTIRNNTVFGTSVMGSGIHIEGAANALVEGNVVIGGGAGAGIWIGAAGVSSLDAVLVSNVIARSNMITGTAWGIKVGDTWNGITLLPIRPYSLGWSNILLEGNNINNTTMSGIKAWGEPVVGATANGLIIKNNIIDTVGTNGGFEFHGIDIESSHLTQPSNVNIEGNLIKNVGAATANTSCIAFLPNQTVGKTNTEAPASNVLIHNNMCKGTNTAHGIYIVNRGTSYLQNWQVQQNDFRNVKYAGQYMIFTTLCAAAGPYDTSSTGTDDFRCTSTKFNSASAWGPNFDLLNTNRTNIALQVVTFVQMSDGTVGWQDGALVQCIDCTPTSPTAQSGSPTGNVTCRKESGAWNCGAAIGQTVNWVTDIVSKPWFDPRDYGAGDCSDPTDIQDAMQAIFDIAYTGRKPIVLPGGCTWIVPDDGGGAFKIPPNVQIKGEDMNTSIVTVPNATTDHLSLGASSILSNLTVSDRFCTISVTWPTSTASNEKVCPTKLYSNLTDDYVNFNGWPNNNFFGHVGRWTNQGGYTTYDRQMGGCINSGVGDCLFVGVTGEGGTGVRNDIYTSGTKEGRGFYSVNYGTGTGADKSFHALLQKATALAFRIELDTAGSSGIYTTDKGVTTGNPYQYSSSTRTSGDLQLWYLGAVFTGNVNYYNFKSGSTALLTNSTIENTPTFSQNLLGTSSFKSGFTYANRPGAGAGEIIIGRCTDCTVGACATPGNGAIMIVNGNAGVSTTSCPF